MSQLRYKHLSRGSKCRAMVKTVTPLRSFAEPLQSPPQRVWCGGRLPLTLRRSLSSRRGVIRERAAHLPTPHLTSVPDAVRRLAIAGD